MTLFDCPKCGTTTGGGLCEPCERALAEAEALKARGMALAEAKGEDELETLRRAARYIAERGDGTADADRVRLYLESLGVEVKRGNHWGSIFRGSEWRFTGERVTSTVTAGHANEIKVWRLTEKNGGAATPPGKVRKHVDCN